VGEVSQHSEYFAFGETFIEEHKNSHNSPYKFNGKELDEESGLYYYGARYYDPRISIWASVDPLANFNPFMDDEHYIDGDHNGGVFNHYNQNVYGYCYQNPVRLIDPNGKQVDIVGDILSWTDVDDITVVVTTVTRGVFGMYDGKPKHIDGTDVKKSDAVYLVVGAIIPAVSGGAVKKFFKGGGDKVIEKIPDALKNRVKLRKETKEAIKKAAPKTKDGRYIDPNTRKPIKKGEEVYGHKTGEEWSKYKKDPANKNKTRKEVIEDQNDPKKYQIEDRKSNASHKFEEKNK